MKKLIILLFITTLLSGCYYFKSGKIIKIEQSKYGCLYEIDNDIWFYPNPKFFAPCSNVNIGDTIILTKQ